MDKLVKDIVSATIGAFETIQKSIEDNTKNLQNVFNELSSKGAENQSEYAKKLRDGVDKYMDTINDLQSKFDNLLKDQQKFVNDSIASVKSKLPNLKIDDLNAKVQDFFNNIKANIKGKPDGSESA